MRKVRRQITDHTEIERLLRSERVCTLALTGEDGPYSVPLNYGYVDGCLYLHGAAEGRKMAMLAADSRVSFCVVAREELVENPGACDFTTHYASVIGFGRAEILQGREEKAAGLAALMSHYREEAESFPDKVLDATAVIRVRIQSMTAKSNPAPPEPS